MARFVFIGYGDQAGYDAGGMAGTPVQVRNHDAAGIQTSEGPFLTAALPVAGFGVIEAADIAG